MQAPPNSYEKPQPPKAFAQDGMGSCVNPPPKARRRLPAPVAQKTIPLPLSIQIFEYPNIQIKTPAHIHFLHTILFRFCWDTGSFNRDFHPAANIKQ